MSFLPKLARILLAGVFLGLVILRLITIINTPDGYALYQQQLAQVGLIGIFAPLLILIQLLGSVGVLLRYKPATYIMAGFSVFLAVVLGRLQPELLFLYLGIAGGMFLLAHYE